MGPAALIPFRLFRSGTFTVAGVMSFILGIGMFGGIVTIPLYFQLVKGASPTESGLLMLPLVVGIMSASLGAGQFTSRTGKYKIMPVIGTGMMVVGLVLLNRVSADSSLIVVDVFMLIFGAGLGLCMQTVVLAMQNSVPAADIGVATSSATFFRQVGGTMGTAVFLSILFSSVGTKVKAAYQGAFAGNDPAFTAAIHNPAIAGTGENAKFLAGLKSPSGSAIDLNDTSFLTGLNQAIKHPFEVGFSQSMDLVFICAAGIILIAFIVSFFLKEVPLRTQSGAQAAASEAEAAVAAAPAPH
jgi:MFS transporter